MMHAKHRITREQFQQMCGKPVTRTVAEYVVEKYACEGRELSSKRTASGMWTVSVIEFKQDKRSQRTKSNRTRRRTK